MRKTRATVTVFVVLSAAACLSCVPQIHAAGTTYRKPAPHLVVTNATFDSIAALAIASYGSDAYHKIDIGEPLQGGLNSITIDMPRGGCLRNFRVTFRNGRTRRFSQVDVCRNDHLRLTSGPSQTGSRTRSDLSGRRPKPRVASNPDSIPEPSE